MVIWLVRCFVNDLCFPLQTAISVVGTLNGPLLGLFSLGILFPSANSKVSVMITAFNLQLAVGHMILKEYVKIYSIIEKDERLNLALLSAKGNLGKKLQ